MRLPGKDHLPRFITPHPTKQGTGKPCRSPVREPWGVLVRRGLGSGALPSGTFSQLNPGRWCPHPHQSEKMGVVASEKSWVLHSWSSQHAHWKAEWRTRPTAVRQQSCPSAHSGDSPTVLPEFLPRPHEARGIGLSDDGDHTAQLSVPLRCTPLLGLASCLIWRGNDAGHLTSESPVPPTGPCRAHHDGLMAQTQVSINLHS